MNFFTSEENFKESCGYDIDGKWYPRVTKIVEIKAKPALYMFYGAAKSYKAAQDVAKLSATEGTKVHEAVEKILLGEAPEVAPDIKPSIDAFELFLSSNSLQVNKELVERRVHHKDHRYAGTVDLIALFNGKFGVMDIKTSQAIYRDYNLQTSAYMEALLPDFPTLQTRWILRIDQVKNCYICGATMRPKGGNNKIRKGRMSLCAEDQHEWSDLQGATELQEFPYWKNDFSAFLSAKKLWEWENEGWLKKVGYLS
ncbi:MAG: hypothetical protein Q8P76_01700 [bacterium]|nr:hypothetical protein [bacterium]